MQRAKDGTIMTKDHVCEFCAKPLEVDTYEWKDAKQEVREDEHFHPEKYATLPCEHPDTCSCGGITRAERIQSAAEYNYLWGRFYASVQNLVVDMIHCGITKDEARDKLVDVTKGLFTDGWIWIDTAVPCPDNQSWLQATHPDNGGNN